MNNECFDPRSFFIINESSPPTVGEGLGVGGVRGMEVFLYIKKDQKEISGLFCVCVLPPWLSEVLIPLSRNYLRKLTERRSSRTSALLRFLVSPRNRTRSPDQVLKTMHRAKETMGSKGCIPLNNLTPTERHRRAERMGAGLFREFKHFQFLSWNLSNKGV